MLAPGIREAMPERMRRTVLEDPVPRLRRLAMPVSLVWGERDAMIPVENADDCLRVLRDASLARLSGVGHAPQEEAPAASLAAVRGFLDHAPAPRTPAGLSRATRSRRCCRSGRSRAAVPARRAARG
jgi:pimeloyl-ACP methyl ester carboxylesterase